MDGCFSGVDLKMRILVDWRIAFSFQEVLQRLQKMQKIITEEGKKTINFSENQFSKNK